tara:strand:- start:249 stop:569 length:321 start_codon:yes stop_codon:yes gene_type:complete
MKIKKTETCVVELSKEAESSTYVASWNGRCDLEFTDRDEHGTVHKIEVCMPLEVARKLLGELTKEVASHDAKQAEKAAEEAAEKMTAEELAEEAERIADEAGVSDI